MGDYHPADYQVEEEHGVHGEKLAAGRLAVPQEGHAGQRAPDKASKDDNAANDDEEGVLGGEQDEPAEDEGKHERQ